MLAFQDIEIDGLILCGSIVPEEFPWSRVGGQLKAPVAREAAINECGTRDVWPPLARSMSWGYGATGTYGFGTVDVQDRIHRMGHSGYFAPTFVRTFWVPFIRNRTITPSKTLEIDKGTPWYFWPLNFRLRWPLLSVVAALLGLAIVKIVGPPPPPASNGGASDLVRVPVQLASGVFERRLPFGVPFVFEGDIPETIQMVSVNYVRLSNPPTVLSDCDAPKLDWKRGGIWRRLPGSAAAKFEVPMPRLQVDDYYCLRFSYGPPYRRPSPQELNAFRAQALDALDKALRNLPDVTSMTTADVDSLRSVLIDTVEVVAGGSVNTPETSIFNRDADLVSMRAVLIDSVLQPVLQEHENRKNQANNFFATRDAARGPMAAQAATDGQYAMLTEAATSRTPADRIATRILPELRKFAYDSAALEGTEDDLGPGNPRTTWDPDIVDSRIVRLRRTIAALDDLVAFLSGPPNAAIVKQLGGAAVATPIIANVLSAAQNTSTLLQLGERQLGVVAQALRNRRSALASVLDDVTQRLQTDVRMSATTR